LIESLELRHFQSHKKTKLEFSPGVNSIIGSSNSGKTAILRALYWAIYNRPSGLSFVSHWNRDKNDKPIKSTFVLVNNGNEIKRIRSDSMNGYEVNGNVLEAIGQDVPKEVSDLFNLDEVNIQKQMDAPFLLSESAGEVARFFNQTIRLDLIDRVLSRAESKRREINKEKLRVEQEQKDIEKQIESFDWVEIAEKQTSKIENIQNKMFENIKSYEALAESLEKYNELAIIKENQEVILSAESLIDRIEAIQKSLNNNSQIVLKLSASLDDWKVQNKVIKGSADFSKAEKLIDEIDEFRKEIYENVKIKELLEKQINEYENYDNILTSLIEDINELENKLPENCPLCGAKING